MSAFTPIDLSVARVKLDTLTRTLPDWACRQCREDAFRLIGRIEDCRAGGDRIGEENTSLEFRWLFAKWKKVPWSRLPVNLPRRESEGISKYLDRCNLAADVWPAADNPVHPPREL